MRLQLPEAKYANCRGAARVLRAAGATARGDRRRRVGRGHDDSAAASGRRAGVRNRRASGRAAHDDELEVAAVTISPRFFEVVGVEPAARPRASRTLTAPPGSETVIINERMASQFFPGEDPIGRRIRFVPREPAPDQPTPPWRTIVGISPSIRHGETRQVELNAGRLHSAPAGTAGRRVAAGPQPAAARRRWSTPCGGRSRPSTRTSRSSRSRRSIRCSTRTAGRSASSA